MKSSGDNGKGGEGRGLPHGWGWREGTGSLPPVVSSYLYAPGADDYNAGAYNDGAWVAYSGESRAEMVDEHDPAPGGPYSPDLLAAAQAAAEAALWRCDGFGVGEVRGLVLGVGHPAMLAIEGRSLPSMQLPDLPGLWRVTRALAVGGGVEVDAVLAPSAAEPVPIVVEAGKPLPVSFSGLHAAGYEVAAPAPSREPSAPAAGDELARLLRGPDGARLDDDIATVRNHAPEIWSGTREHVLRVARACELLLAERERMAARVLAMTEDRAEAAERHVERAMKDGATAVAGWTKTGKDLEAARARIAELTATPPPHTVAALLARVEAEAVPDRSTWRDYTRGLNKAADIIRATLTPSPLDAVAAEVCAEHKRIADLGPWDPHDHWAAICTEADSIKTGVAPGRVRLMRVGAQALAGMLACDAAPAPCDYCRARDAGRATTARGCTCGDAAKGGARG